MIATPKRVVNLAGHLLSEDEIASITPCRLPQRHRSWLIVLRSGDRCWLKVSRGDVGVAGVRREAEVLRQLSSRFQTPRLLVADPGNPPCSITAHLTGTPLAALDEAAVAGALPSLARWVRSFGHEAAIAPHPGDAVAPWDLFGVAPDVARLLGEGAEFWADAARRLGLRAPVQPLADSVAAPVGSVHGSFDEDNVLVDQHGTVTGVLDLEAARAGPPALDVAGLATDLLLRAQPGLARTWVDLWIAGDEQQAALVHGFVQLRLWYRHQAGLLPASVIPDALWLLDQVA